MPFKVIANPPHPLTTALRHYMADHFSEKPTTTLQSDSTNGSIDLTARRTHKLTHRGAAPCRRGAESAIYGCCSSCCRVVRLFGDNLLRGLFQLHTCLAICWSVNTLTRLQVSRSDGSAGHVSADHGSVGHGSVGHGSAGHGSAGHGSVGHGSAGQMGQRVMGPRIMGQRVMDQSVMGHPVMGQPVMGKPVMGRRVMGPRIMDQSVMGHPVMDQSVMGRRIMGQRVMGRRVMGRRVIGRMCRQNVMDIMAHGPC